MCKVLVYIAIMHIILVKLEDFSILDIADAAIIIA